MLPSKRPVNTVIGFAEVMEAKVDFIACLACMLALPSRLKIASLQNKPFWKPHCPSISMPSAHFCNLLLSTKAKTFPGRLMPLWLSMSVGSPSRIREQ